MIQAIIGTTLKRKTYTLTPDTTLKAALEGAKADTGVDYTVNMITMDGASLGTGDINKTFKELGYDGTYGHDQVYLLAVQKADNA